MNSTSQNRPRRSTRHQKDDLPGGAAAYEDGLRAHVIRNQDIAPEQNAGQRTTIDGEPTDAGEAAPTGGVPDFARPTVPFAPRTYQDLVRLP
ncbi:hypothetical protein [Streptosporangium sp. NPDC049046]|uniref:hypothetical protein n=1 Tax=Streptosporangium sp. NPDC049046 TaxID=3155031 RepID=UPI00342542F5